MVDTSATRDTTDTSGVQNPPGYQGMEADAGAVEGQATGADTTSVEDTEPMKENPAGGDTAGPPPEVRSRIRPEQLIVSP